jgi:hypothetical protein
MLANISRRFTVGGMGALLVELAKTVTLSCRPVNELRKITVILPILVELEMPLGESGPQ